MVGPHPRMRFLEYVALETAQIVEQRDHPPHADTPLQDAGSDSYITVLLYLNSDFNGGELQFLGENEITIEPKEGMVVVFPHRLVHQAKKLQHGTKQLLKVSVLYSEDRVPMPSSSSCTEVWGRNWRQRVIDFLAVPSRPLRFRSLVGLVGGVHSTHKVKNL